jgi:hypothetical protein
VVAEIVIGHYEDVSLGYLSLLSVYMF